MSTLVIQDLHVRVGGLDILRGVNLEIASGEVHALMGPNGSGKSTLSHALMGREGYEVTQGSVMIDGEELIGQPTWLRSRAGLFLSHQYPVEVPGVRILDLLEVAAGVGESVVQEEALRIGVAAEFLDRGVNVEFSGGEQKRAETLQLALLRPKFAILDEVDSGLDVDALRDVARRIEMMTSESELGVLAITHYSRLLTVLRPDRVHMFIEGRVIKSGGPELADELERTGYEIGEL
ncbi:MAG: Fe-S cluster assembly ATPase SufC [Acidimicrobiia bacterium]|nr:Fe-S cluster assembly ATPase SufC [Acidimicrobiia bacterium]